MRVSGTRAGVLPRGRRAWASFAAGAALVLLAALPSLLRPQESYPALEADCDRSELFVAGGTDVSLKNQRRALIRQWNEGRRPDGSPRPHATLVEVAEPTDLQHSQIKAVQESGSCAYDVLILDNTWTAQFADAGYLRPLHRIDDLDDFFPAALRTGEWDGELYAVPFNVDVGLLYHREDATPPATWRALLSSDVALQLSDYEGLTVNALEAVWNGGGAGVLTGAGLPVGTERLAVRDLRTKAYRALVRLTPYVHGTLARSRRYGEQESIEAFAAGTPLMRNWPYAFSVLASEPRMRDGTRLRFGVTALPGRTVLGGQNLAVSAHSPDPGAAAELVEFLSGTAAQRLLFSCGGFAPGRYSALGLSSGRASPAEVNVRSCSSLTGRPLGPGERDVPDEEQLTGLARAVVTALSRAEPRPVTPHYSTFTGTFRDCVQKIFDRAGTDAESFAEAVGHSMEGRAASC